jgi:hypothetical protein
MRQKLIVLMSAAIRRITNIVARPWGNVPHSNVRKVFTSGKMQSLGIANHGNATRTTRKTERSVAKKSLIATAMQASVLPERCLSPMRQMSHVKVRNAQKKRAAFTQLAVCIMIAPTTLSQSQMLKNCYAPRPTVIAQRATLAVLQKVYANPSNAQRAPYTILPI